MRGALCIIDVREQHESVRESLSSKRGLLIGNRNALSVVTCKALKIELSDSQWFAEAVAAFEAAFPDLPLIIVTDSADGHGENFLVVFDNDEQLVEFKLRYL